MRGDHLLRGLAGAARFDGGRFALAAELYERMMTGREFPEFLTLVAYDLID